MPNYNQQILIGHAGDDAPAVRHTQTGKIVTNVNIAYTEKFGGNSRTMWTKVTFWGRTAEIAAVYLKKGNAVMIIGTAGEPECWIDKRSGEPKAMATLTAREMKLLGGSSGARGAVDEQQQRGGLDGPTAAFDDWEQAEDLGPLSPGS